MTEEMLEISDMVDPSSLGIERSLLAPGDAILEVNGRDVSDQIEFYFLLPEEGGVRLKIRRKQGALESITLESDTLRALRLRFSPMKFKRCRCKCVFCFVDQMPKGLRSGLYVKDEDYRLSFLYGNFTTMNDLDEEEMDRIVEYHLSPQYVSVHAVERELREKIFGRPMRRDILETLRRLAEAGIEIHTQAVICPGLNDGHHMRRTIEELFALHENIRTLAAVPVGLTEHRKGLPRLRRFTREESELMIETIESYQEGFLSSSRKSRFVFASDELYLDAAKELPPWDQYEEFPQLENGVGMTRRFVDLIDRRLADVGIPRDLSSIGIVTGRLGERVFEHYVFPLLQQRGAEVLPPLAVVSNRLFGEEVTVSGLLSGRDVATALKRMPGGKTYFLPPNCLSHETLFLDDMGVGKVADLSGKRIRAAGDSLIDSFWERADRGGMDG